jgi:hypothetical protein
MSLVTTQPQMLAWPTENLQGINWPTATLVSQREFGGSDAVLDRRPKPATCLEVWPNTSVWQETDDDLANQRLRVRPDLNRLDRDRATANGDVTVGSQDAAVDVDQFIQEAA